MQRVYQKISSSKPIHISKAKELESGTLIEIIFDERYKKIGHGDNYTLFNRLNRRVGYVVHMKDKKDIGHYIMMDGYQSKDIQYLNKTIVFEDQADDYIIIICLDNYIYDNKRVYGKPDLYKYAYVRVLDKTDENIARAGLLRDKNDFFDYNENDLFALIFLRNGEFTKDIHIGKIDFHKTFRELDKYKEDDDAMPIMITRYDKQRDIKIIPLTLNGMEQGLLKNIKELEMMDENEPVKYREFKLKTYILYNLYFAHNELFGWIFYIILMVGTSIFEERIYVWIGITLVWLIIKKYLRKR